MRLHIVTDGSPKNTRILDAATGQRIVNVKQVEYVVGLDRVLTAIVHTGTRWGGPTAALPVNGEEARP